MRRLRDLVVTTAGLLAAVGPLVAQVSLSMVGFSPPSSPTAAATVALGYDLSSPASDPLNLVFTRDDGTTVNVAGVVPGTGPFSVSVPLPRGVDGTNVRFVGVAFRPLTGEVAGGNRALAIEVDDTGPAAPTTLTPAPPFTTQGATLSLTGRVLRRDGRPDGGGRVEVRRGPGGTVLGGGLVRSDGGFTASIDASTLPPGASVGIELRAFDQAGNAGLPLATTLTRRPAGAGPSLTGLTLTPPSGTVTSAPGVVVRGTAGGGRPPLRVTFLVDGFVESSLGGLAASTPFAQTLTLPGEGSHTLTVRVQDATGVVSSVQTLGTVTLDRTPPLPPLVTSPSPGAPLITNLSSITISGVVREQTPTSGIRPRVLLRCAAPIRFTPAQPQEVTDPGGRFSTIADLTSLPDGAYVIEVLVADAAGNWSSPGASISLGRSKAAASYRDRLRRRIFERLHP